MQKNRLVELRRLSKKPTAIGSKLRESLVSEGPSDIYPKDDISYCKQIIKSLKNLIFEMNEMKKDYSRVTRANDEKQIMNQVNSIVKKGNMYINDLQKTILKLNEEFEKGKNENQSESSERKTNQSKNGVNLIECANITRKGNEAIKQYKQAQQKFTATVRSTIKRQATIIKREEISEEQVDEMVHNPQIAQNMLKERLLNAPSSQLENAVSDIIDKCRDIVKLEKNVHECVEMMKQLAILTQIQGEQINTIGSAISGAKDYVEEGEVKLVNAKVYYKKSQKKLCCIIMLVVLILGVVLIPVLITQL